MTWHSLMTDPAVDQHSPVLIPGNGGEATTEVTWGLIGTVCATTNAIGVWSSNAQNNEHITRPPESLRKE